MDLDSFRVQQTFTGTIPLVYSGCSGKTDRDRDKGDNIQEEFDFLSNIIKTLNDAYGANLTDEDKVDMAKKCVKRSTPTRNSVKREIVTIQKPM